MPDDDDDACSVYFMREQGVAVAAPARIKIGMAASPEARLSQLQTGNPNRIELVHAARFATRRAAQRCERALHDAHRASRVHREWFSLDDRQLAAAMRDADRRAAADDGGGGLLTMLLPRTAGIGDAGRARRSVGWAVVVIGVVALVAVAVVGASRKARGAVKRRVGGWASSLADDAGAKLKRNVLNGVDSASRRLLSGGARR